MKSLHRTDLFAWSQFDTSRNVDFTGHLLVNGVHGNVAIDPLPTDAHDTEHIDSLGGVAWVLISNADHVRDARGFVERWGARVAAPAGDRSSPELKGLPVALWMQDEDELSFGVRCIGMRGSKTPGELAFLLADGGTVITGDLVRGQVAGSLNLLPDAKLSDRAAALESVRRLAELPELEAVLVGDGQSVFRDGRQRLQDLLRGCS